MQKSGGFGGFGGFGGARLLLDNNNSESEDIGSSTAAAERYFGRAIPGQPGQSQQPQSQPPRPRSRGGSSTLSTVRLKLNRMSECYAFITGCPFYLFFILETPTLGIDSASHIDVDTGNVEPLRNALPLMLLRVDNLCAKLYSEYSMSSGSCPSQRSFHKMSWGEMGNSRC